MNFEDFTADEIEHFINTGEVPERKKEAETSNSFGSGNCADGTCASSETSNESVPEPKPVVMDVFNEPGTLVPEPIPTVTTKPPITKPDGFDIRDPVELLFLLDDNVREGRVVLHNWQIQFMMDFAENGENDTEPFQALVRACNGSGKDKYCIAPCAVWMCMRFCKSRSVVTSSSGKQLDAQTCTYIEMLCEEANRKIAPNIWKINYRYYECLATGSPIECFATDEGGKAEGFHPLEFGRKMALFMSEAKSVPDEVNIAFNKCTGYTHRAHVSTPGLPLGHFYEYCQRSPYRKDHKELKEISSIDYVQYHVTAYDCTHISRTYIEQMKRDLPGGENGAAFKSQVMAEFGTTDEMVVIPYTFIWQAVNNPPRFGHLRDDWNTAGVDLSAGGDETVFAVRNGNKLLAVHGFRYNNTQASITYLDKLFRQYNLAHPRARIHGDAGGLGKPMLDSLREIGWKNIKFVQNQGEPRNKSVYTNKGTEMWFDFAKLMENREVILLNDDKSKQQLSTRYYKITADNRHQLESKKEARAKGHPSPDRADAIVLAFNGYKSRIDEPEYEKPYKEEENKPVEPAFQLRKWAKADDKQQSLNPSRKIDFTLLREELRAINQQRKQE